MKNNPGSLRILHLASAKNWRGGEQQVAYLAEALRARGHMQWIFCAAGSAMEHYCRAKQFDFFTYTKGFAFHLHAARRIGQLCRSLKITHLHAHDSHAHTFAVLAAAFFNNKTPLIVHRRVDFPVGGNAFSRWKYNHPAVRTIICVSNFIRRLMEPALADPAKLTVVHSGIDMARFDPENDRQYLRREFNVKPAEWIVANVAAIAPHKDYFTFVRTADVLIRRNFPGRFFIIGGDGGEEAAIRAFIRERGLEPYFVLTGFRKDVHRLLPGIDVLLFTSKTEGLGTTLLDAFACGVPVVATDAGGIPELVEDGVTGLLAHPGFDEILARQVERVRSDEKLRHALVANALERVRNFTTEKMAARVRDCYEAI